MKLIQWACKYGVCLNNFAVDKEGFRAWCACLASALVASATWTENTYDDATVAIFAGVIDDDAKYDALWAIVSRWMPGGEDEADEPIVYSDKLVAGGVPPEIVALTSEALQAMLAVTREAKATKDG